MKKPGRKFILSIIYCFLLALQVFAMDSFLQGQKLFRENKPAEALPYLLEVTAASNPEPAAFNYLGLAYTQLRQYDEAIAAFTSGVEVPFANTPLLYFNAGNVAFFAENYPLAEELYTKSFDADPFYAKAVLNRANTYLKQQKIPDAFDDYTLYLQLVPTAPQRALVQQMAVLLDADIQAVKKMDAQRKEQEAKAQAEAETQKQIAETKERERVEAEAEKTRVAAQVAAEQAKRADERQKLLEQISSSLKSSDSTNISAGSEGVLGYTYEPELE